jgi:XTP/dITP diphosphohydrolase
MRLYIATSNAGKLRDFAFAASTFADVEILPLPGLDQIGPPEESADSFRGNALIKARAYGALAPGEIVLADDSGIEVPALGGAPGVRSARYADDQAWPGAGETDQRNNAALLAAAAALEDKDRQASYRCVLTAVRGTEVLATAEGELTGVLLREPRGTGGFGYDSLFYLPDLDLTMAEVDPQTRLQLSHRGRALQKLLDAINVTALLAGR